MPPAGSKQTWRLYFGVPDDKPLHGMYSFFPCQPFQAGSKGFCPPQNQPAGVITDNLNQGKKLAEPRRLNEMKRLWGTVADQVKEQGLALGVYAEMFA